MSHMDKHMIPNSASNTYSNFLIDVYNKNKILAIK